MIGLFSLPSNRMHAHSNAPFVPHNMMVAGKYAVMKAAARAGPDEPATRGVVSPQPLVLARQRRPR